MKLFKTLLGMIAFIMGVVGMFLLGINDLTTFGYQVAFYSIFGCLACCVGCFALSNGR